MEVALVLLYGAPYFARVIRAAAVIHSVSSGIAYLDHYHSNSFELQSGWTLSRGVRWRATLTRSGHAPLASTTTMLCTAQYSKKRWLARIAVLTGPLPTNQNRTNWQGRNTSNRNVNWHHHTDNKVPCMCAWQFLTLLFAHRWDHTEMTEEWKILWTEFIHNDTCTVIWSSIDWVSVYSHHLPARNCLPSTDPVVETMLKDSVFMCLSCIPRTMLD